MALARRSGKRFEANIWPGFVDAMTALLLVLVFVLSIFMIVQFMLRETVTSQEVELDELGAQVQSLAEALGLEQQRGFTLEQQVDQLDDALQDQLRQAQEQASLIATLTAQSNEQAGRIASFEEQVAGLLSEQRDLRGQINSLTTARDAADAENVTLSARLEDLEAGLAREITEREAAQLALSQARGEIDAQIEAARLAAARRKALEALVADLESSGAETSAALESSEAARLAEAAAAEALRERLENADAELTAMSLSLEAQRREAEETLTLLAAARAAEAELGAELDALRLNEEQNIAALSEAQRQAALLATAEQALAQERELSGESQRQVEALNQQVAALRGQLGSLQALLDAAEARDRDADVQISALGQQLNAALAQVADEQRKLAQEAERRAELEAAERRRLEEEAKELENVRSEFFAQLRDLLGDQEGIRIEGDRFVFSSEVLFALGSADLSLEGQQEVAKVAAILQEISRDIPPEVDWVIRVDGHTDATPIRRGRYRDNWELSQARALSVVRYMSGTLGIPPERLAANGFGEFQPVANGDSPEALAQNRRIELKLTER